MLYRDHIFLSLLLSFPFIQGSQLPNADVIARQSGGKVVTGTGGSVSHTPSNTGEFIPVYEGQNNTTVSPQVSNNGPGSSSFGGVIGFLINAGKTSERDKRDADIETALRKEERDRMYGTGGLTVGGTRQSATVRSDTSEMQKYYEEEMARQAAATARSQIIQAERLQQAAYAQTIATQHPAVIATTPIPSSLPLVAKYNSKDATVEWILKNKNTVSDAELDKGVEQLRAFLNENPTTATPVIQPYGWSDYSFDVWNGANNMIDNNPVIVGGVAILLAGGAIYYGAKTVFGWGKPAVGINTTREIREHLTATAPEPAPIEQKKSKQPKRDKTSHHRHPNPSPDPRTTGVDFRFPENPGQRDHGWRFDGGHIEKGTPKAREVIINTIKNGKYHGQDDTGNHQYSMIQPDGNQTFAKVRDNGMIQNQGGCPPGKHWIVGEEGFLVRPDGWDRRLIKPLQYGFAGLLSGLASNVHAGIDYALSPAYEEEEEVESEPKQKPRPVYKHKLPTAPFDHKPLDGLPDMPEAMSYIGNLKPAPRSHTANQVRKESRKKIHFAAKNQVGINKMINRKNN
jgi:hypothetical protein